VDNKPFKLCYVDDHFAYFTTQELCDQYGDDWNDVPYEHNAGRPSEWNLGDHRAWEICKVAFEANMRTPADIAYSNSAYSVDMINAGMAPWLASDPRHVDKPPYYQIYAGVSIEEFTRTIHAAGGQVYFSVPPEYVPSSQTITGERIV